MEKETVQEELKIKLRDEYAQNQNVKKKATLLRTRQGRIEREIG